MAVADCGRDCCTAPADRDDSPHLRVLTVVGDGGGDKSLAIPCLAGILICRELRQALRTPPVVCYSHILYTSVTETSHRTYRV